MQLNKNRLAVVGPADSVALISEVAQERGSQLKVFPIIYQDASEVPEILRRYDNEIDFWLFSGKVPYCRAVISGNTQKPLYYIPHTGSSLYRVLVQIANSEKLPINNISFDTFSKKEIEEAFADISPDIPRFYLLEYDGVISAGDVADYHYELWKSGKIEAAVTCFLSSYQKLRGLGVPAFRIWPTRDTIRTMLSVAISEVEASRFKGGQIAIQHIAIDGYEDFIRESASNYAAKRTEMRLYELLLNYTEAVKGSIILHGNGQYTIYSTRGVVEELTRQFTVMPILDDVTRELVVGVSGGIGFGSTAYAAEENAHIALGLAQRAGKGKWMVVLDDKTVCGPLNSATHLRYSLRADEPAFRELAAKLNVSATTVNRIFAACDKLDHATVNADDLAPYLGITPRSTRRLLASMVANGLAEVAGEEGFGKGRPRKLYNVNLDRLLPRP
ncbi:GTP cyclohydrolase [Anaeroselena agilis]|uniref:GTP cyclohydrolase n=1 Tax=Anaeroselena agilis TaxID=3063788 RepID=A0ABU3P2B6_9FIRM|nr:GTP cyclohydrolase [Selenomonadales bacterium 4137-cl]